MQEAGSKPPKLNSGKHKNSQRLTQVIKTEPKVKKGSLKWKYIDPLRQGQRLDTTKTKQYQLPNGNDLSSPWTNATIPPSKCYQLSTNRSNRFPKPVPPVSHAQDQNRFHRFPNRPDRFTYTDCSKPKMTGVIERQDPSPTMIEEGREGCVGWREESIPASGVVW
jgi:hypothetical protein